MADEGAAAQAAATSGGQVVPALDPFWAWLGQVAFDTTARLQEDLRAAVVRGTGPEGVLLCEHDPVVTLGRRARPEHLLLPAAEFARLGIAIRPATRGGEATYHGPGQLVAYPVVRLRRGVLAHVEAMAAAVIALLRAHDVGAEWRRAEPGVWVGEAKICAFGVHVRRGVAIHGLALNLTLPPERFAPIVPCGKPGGRVTSLHAELLRQQMPSLQTSSLPGPRNAITPASLAPSLARELACSLGLRFAERPADALVKFRDCKSEIVTDSME